MKPKISIITPTFNQARYIGQTLDSVLSQQGDFELEYIVVDGGSTDGTVDILKRHGDAIRWVSEPDEGQTDALNKGIAMATGEVVGWINSDDLYEPGALQAAMEVFAAEPPIQWVYGKVRIVDKDNREIRRWITWYKVRRMRRYSFSRLLRENWMKSEGAFWRRSAGEQVGPFKTEYRLSMDYEFFLRLADRWPGRFIDRYLSRFRWYPASKSGAGYVPQFFEALRAAKTVAAGRYKWAIVCHYGNLAKNIAAYWLMGLARRIAGTGK